MKQFAKIAVRSVLILILVFLLLVLLARSLFIVTTMPTDSMQPLINTNDIIVATKWIRVASLRTGDFVVVNIPIPGGYVLTVRQIEQQTNAPAGQFYLRAANTNGYDSRQFGTLGASNIVGRIIWILK